MAFLTLFNRRGGSFSPDDLTGLAATVLPAESLAAGLLWQDTAKTIPAELDGDPVRVAVCPYTAVEFTAPSDAARPLLYEEGGGKWSLMFDGVDDGLRSTAEAVGATTIAFRYTALTGGGVIRVVNSGTINGLVHPRRTGLPFYVDIPVSITNWSDDAATHTTVVRKTGGGGFWTVRADSVDLSVSSSVSTDFGTVCLGSGPSFAETFSGRIASLLLLQSNVSGDDLTAMETYLSTLL